MAAWPHCWDIASPLCPCSGTLCSLCWVLAAVPVTVSAAKPVVLFPISQVTFSRLHFPNSSVSALLETSAK